MTDENAELSIFAGRSALVVEDNAFMRQLIRSLLRQFGFDTIIEATDGSVGLRRLLERPVDVAICDWMMAPVDGYGFLQSLRRHPDPIARSLPVIMLTSVSTLASVTAARDAGVTEYLIKPISSGKLRERLLAVFKRPRSFVVSDYYVGPDRRRREDPDYDGALRRTADRPADHYPLQDPTDWTAAAAGYVEVLREEANHLRRALEGVGVGGAPSVEAWRSVHRVAHDLKGHAPTFGYTVAAAVADSLESLLRPAVRAPETFDRATERRVRAARAHLQALSMIVEQHIVGGSPETDALVDRLRASVARVHREAAA